MQRQHSDNTTMMAKALVTLVMVLAMALASNVRAADRMIKDKELKEKLTQAMEEEIEAGRAVMVSTLLDQPARDRCEVDLVPPSRSKLDPEEVYLRACHSVVVIGRLNKCTSCPKWHAAFVSGFIISEAGIVATSSHILKGSDRTTLGVMTYDGRVYPVKEVLASQRDVDIAFLRIDRKGLIPLPVRSEAPVGSRVFVLSHAAGQLYTFTEGMVSRHWIYQPDGKDGSPDSPPIPILSITADYARSSSGAPVLDESCAVVGIVNRTKSIYHTTKKDVEQNLQMVLKHCTPSSSLLKLVGRPVDGAAARGPAHRTTSRKPVKRTVPPEPAGRTVSPEPAGRTVSPEPAGRTEISEWTRKQALEELAGLAFPQKKGKTGGSVPNRAERATAWLAKLNETKLDLGKDAYVKAISLYLKHQQTKGSPAGLPAAALWLADHIMSHGGLPESASKYAGWIQRLLPHAIDEAFTNKEYDKIRTLLPVLAKCSNRGSYSVYATLGTKLIASADPESDEVVVDILSMAMADTNMDADMRVGLVRFLYGNPEKVSNKKSDVHKGGDQGRTASARRIHFVPFSGKDLDGKEVSIEDFKGKVLLVDFWATWCSPCMREMPNVVATYSKFKDNGMAVLGVTLDKEGRSEKIRSVMKKTAMDWPQIYDCLCGKSRPSLLNNISSIPSTFLLDRTGRPRYTNLRGKELERRVAELVEEK